MISKDTQNDLITDIFRDEALEYEDLDEFDPIDEEDDHGAPPLFMSVGATLSCIGGAFIAHSAHHGPVGFALAALGTVGFAGSTYYFNRPHHDKQARLSDAKIGHVWGFGTGVILTAGQAYLYKRHPATRLAAVHLGLIGAVSILYHGNKMAERFGF